MGRTKWSTANKWTKTKVLLQNRKLQGFIPETRPLTRQSLLEMLNKYQMVYIKPYSGSKGRGVIKVQKIQGNSEIQDKARYRYQSGLQVLTFSRYDQLFTSIRSSIGGESYIVQQGIMLLNYKGRPFDIRLMIQQNPKGHLEVTGYLARVAHPHKIVTNGSQGGTIYPVDRLLKSYTSILQPKQFIQQMKQLGILATRELRGVNADIQEIGLDIAIDQQGRMWILEANTLPDAAPFSLLDNKQMLSTIVRYGKAYGRRYSVTCKHAKKGL